MYFESLYEVFFMDGHGVYVWSAYLFTSSVLLIMVWLPIVRLRRSIKRLASKYKAG